MPDFKSKKENLTFFAKVGAVMVLWILMSWFVADTTVKSHTRELIQLEAISLDNEVSNSAKAIDFSLDYLHGIAALVAQDEKVLAAQLHFGISAVSTMPVEQRRMKWSRDSLLKNLDGYLGRVGISLGADVVWITNAAGDCIASSNAKEAESFIGTNYADRDYFRMAKKGKSWQQYAIGRMTNIPGLYFSAPINIRGRFAGVAVAKIDIPKLTHWINRTDAFISDEHGIIIFARDPDFEMRALPDANVAQMPDAERMARYKRTVFRPLAIATLDDEHFPSLRYFDLDPTPLLLASKQITDEALNVHAFKRLPAVAEFGHERLKLFLSISTSGTLVLMLVAGTLFFARIRKHTELRAAKSASLLQAAIESTIDGILVVDNERHITAYNRRFVEIWHIRPELAASGRDDEVLECAANQAADRQEFIGKVLDLYRQPELTSSDTLRLKDGTDIERYSAPQRLGSKIVGRVWSFRDVTKRKKAEQALRDSRDELEIKVRERTADLQSANSALISEKARQEELINQLAEAHSQLLQSEKMASIGQLAAGVAHEINNPVGYVNSNLSTLQEYVADLFKVLSVYEQNENEMSAATREKISALKKQIDVAFMRDDIGKLMIESIGGLQRVKRIVLDLKDFSHVGESAKLWANIEQGMDSTLNVVWNELKYKAEVIKEYGGIPEIECIPTQINQVFMNLLMNAVQAIKEHGRITIRTGQEGGNVWVEVEDTGSGIEPKNLSRVFDPFFTTKPVGKGTGLGLSLSYSIVQKHGGKIELRSELGKGTVFKVILPLQADSETGVTHTNGATPDIKQISI